jgi:hypothetical protein
MVTLLKYFIMRSQVLTITSMKILDDHSDDGGSKDLWNSVSFCQTAHRIGGVVVSVLATGPKARGFKTGQGDGFLRVIKIRSKTFFGWDTNPEVPCHKFYSTLKISWSLTGTDRLNSHFLHPLPYSLQRCLCWQDRQTILVAARALW